VVVDGEYVVSAAAADVIDQAEIDNYLEITVALVASVRSEERMALARA
jgi:hypothetical protein